MLWCFRSSPTLDDLDYRGSSRQDAADIPMEDIQSVIDFASACIAREGRACNDAVSVQLSVVAVQELRRNLSAVQHAIKQKMSTRGSIYDPDLVGEQTGLAPVVSGYLECHLPGIQRGEGIQEDRKSCSLDSRHNSQQNALSETHTAPPPLPLLAPHFFHRMCKAQAGRAYKADVWPAIRESLEEEMRTYACSGLDQAGVGQISDGIAGTASLKYPDLVPNSAVSFASGMTGEIDNMIDSSAADGLAMTTVNAPQVSPPRTEIDSDIAQILESMVCP